ncbi:hypothetical protein Ctob_016404, partial [Chrysochromulina tobinii]
MQAQVSMTITATEFNTESGYDFVRIGNAAYSGSTGPMNVQVVAGTMSRASLTDTYGPAQIYWNGVSVGATSSMRFPLPVSRSNMYVGKSNWA